jgi:excisionase family DNA binding protein
MLTVDEVAARLRVSRESVRRWARQGRLRAVHVGRQLRIPPEEVNRILSDGLDSPVTVSRRAEPPRQPEPAPDDDPPATWSRYQACSEPGDLRGPRIIG